MRQFVLFLFILISNLLQPQTFAQTLTQTMRGRVIDVESQLPVIGANVVIEKTQPLMGATTDIDGNFKILNVPVGRYQIQVTSVGYQTQTVPEVLISTGKETVLQIQIQAALNELSTVTISANNKSKPVNSMAYISARSFTVEETRRYAGGLDDPARMVSAFAGVTVGNIQDNAIIIRGNSPKGVLWKVEGITVPNPSHFPNANVAGGGFTTIFSNQLLTNSDFYTGAFPAEYGNALAGVFDIKFRNGNNEKRESAFQIGALGIDVSSEGPFVKGKQATYLFNYRYSTFGLLVGLGIIPSQQVPLYQDLSFKINVPTKKAGTFTWWGIASIDKLVEPDELDSTKWRFDWDRVSFEWNLRTFSSGLAHKYIFNDKSYINTTIAFTGTHGKMNQDYLNDSLVKKPFFYITDNANNVILSSFVKHKFSSKHSVKVGVEHTHMMYDMTIGSIATFDINSFRNMVKSNGQTDFTQTYIQSKYTINDKWALNTGIHAGYFWLNGSYSIDPRVGVNFTLNDKHSLSIGYGTHSQLEELKIYFIKPVGATDEMPNKNLQPAQAQHFIFEYQWQISDNLRIKMEPYYQYLYNVPGIADSSWSMINFKQEWGFMGKLENNSVGKNMGIDITFERFFKNSYYFLTTLSVFDSRYKADDDVWRNTRYNKHYALNLLGGKEFFLRRNKVLGLNVRFNLMGGERITPYNENLSVQNHRMEYDYSKTFENSQPPMNYLDLTITYQSNRKKYSSVWALQVKNLLGSPIHEGFYYNYQTKKITESKTVVIVPSISYKIQF